MARNPNRPSRRRKREGSGLGNGANREEKSGLERDEEPSGLEGTPAPDPLEQASPDIEMAKLAEAGAELPDDEGGKAPDKAEHAPPSAGGRRGGVGTFLRNCVEELRRVQWPDRRQVGQATAVVLGFVVLAGGFLGLMDTIWKPVVEAIL